MAVHALAACRNHKGYEEVRVPAVKTAGAAPGERVVLISEMEDWAQLAFTGYKCAAPPPCCPLCALPHNPHVEGVIERTALAWGVGERGRTSSTVRACVRCWKATTAWAVCCCRGHVHALAVLEYVTVLFSQLTARQHVLMLACSSQPVAIAGHSAMLQPWSAGG